MLPFRRRRRRRCFVCVFVGFVVGVVVLKVVVFAVVVVVVINAVGDDVVVLPLSVVVWLCFCYSADADALLIESYPNNR